MITKCSITTFWLPLGEPGEELQWHFLALDSGINCKRLHLFVNPQKPPVACHNISASTVKTFLTCQFSFVLCASITHLLQNVQVTLISYCAIPELSQLFLSVKIKKLSATNTLTLSRTSSPVDIASVTLTETQQVVGTAADLWLLVMWGNDWSCLYNKARCTLAFLRILSRNYATGARRDQNSCVNALTEVNYFCIRFCQFYLNQKSRMAFCILFGNQFPINLNTDVSHMLQKQFKGCCDPALLNSVAPETLH